MNKKAKSPVMIYNELPRPTFRTIKVNHLELEELPNGGAGRAYTPQYQCQGDVSLQFYEGNGMPELGDFQGANRDMLAQALGHANTGCVVEAAPGAKGTVRLTYDVSGHMNGQLKVTAQAGSDITVYIVFCGDEGDVNFLHYIQAADDAHVRIVKVQLHGDHVRHIEHRYAKAEARSVIDYVSAELGGREAIIYCKTDMMHEESIFRSKSMYVGKDKQIIDFSYWIPMQGKKTQADIMVTGALKDEAKKAFRGTIDFLRGSRQAVGAEADTCILLNRNAHSISVPLLLCKEDDVVGNHASSAGQIDEDTLFYLMSRGFDYKESQSVVVESNLRPVIDALGDDGLADQVLETVRNRMNSRI